ncbi:cytochrome P450 [Byssothecium circinans]|uniref:Cytochrome P450 n=1 Tax=Byssothecium circinans TaxID=147558 RepID=A0A6A5U0V0_9PLEO|nr:cytochrome P450 [Byssothecium circinans]
MDNTSLRILALRNWPLFLFLICFAPVFSFVVTAPYNVYFHPLKKYPGPKFAAATNLLLYKKVNGHELNWTHAMHEKYGEVVRVGPNKLSYISAQAWKDINGHRTNGRPEIPKDPRFYFPTLNGEHSLLTILDAHTHGQVRKIFTNAFSDKALRLQEPLIKTYVNQLVGNMKQKLSANSEIPFSMEKMYNFTTFDVMGDLTFGKPPGLLNQSKYTPWVDTAIAQIRADAVLTSIAQYPWLMKLAQWLMPKKMNDKRREHFEHSAHRVDKRLAQDTGENKPDIWSLVLEKGMDQLSLPKIHANAALFMVAGTETTATLLSGLTFYLLKNPTKHQKLPYLNACIEEGLRVYAPFPNGLPRQTPQGGTVICGDWVPEKTGVYVSPGAAFWSSLNFKDPDSFIPERWLPGTGYDSDKKDVMQPFSFGPRNCIGKNLAYHEARVILASVLWHFDLELNPLSAHWANQKTYIAREKRNLLVNVRLRQHTG